MERIIPRYEHEPEMTEAQMDAILEEKHMAMQVEIDREIEAEMKPVLSEAAEKSMTEHHLYVLTNSLSFITQRLSMTRDSIADLNKELQATVERAAQERADAYERADKDYVVSMARARQGHLAASRQFESEMADLVANKDALTLAYEALRASGR